MRRIWVGIAAAILLGAASPAWAGAPSSDADADGEANASSRSVNQVAGLEVKHDKDGTYLRLESSKTPSFSVFKLKNPLRLVVDVSNARLEGEGTLREVDDGIISQVSLLENQKSDGARVRLIVGFERAAHYDVRTNDQDVVIFVEGEPTDTAGRADGGGSKGARELAATRDDVDRAKSEVAEVEEKLSSARSKIERLKGELQQAQDSSEKKRLRAEVRGAKKRASRLEDKLQRKSQRVASLEQKVQKLEAQLSSEKTKARKRARRLRDLRDEREKWSERLEARNQKVQEATRELDAKEKQLSQLRRELEKLKKERNRAEGEEKERLQEQLERRSQRLDALEKQLETKRETVASLQEDVRKLERQRDRARQKISQLEEKYKKRLEKSESRYESAANKLDATRTRLEEARKEIERLRERKAESSGEAAKKIARKLANKKQKLASMRRKLESRQKTAQKLRDKVERLQRQKSESNEKLDATRKRVEQAKQKLRNYKQRVSERDETIETLEERIASLEKRADRSEEQNEQLSALRSKLDRERNQVSKLREARSRLESRLSELRKTKREAKRSVQKHKARAERARDKLESYEQRLEERDQKISKLEKQLAEAKQSEQRDHQKISKLKERLAEAREANSSRSKSSKSSKRAARAVPVDRGADDPSAGENQIRDIRLETRNGTSRIVVELERPGTYKRLPWKDSRAVMLLKNVKLPDRLEQTIAAGESGAVRFVSSYAESNGKVRMEAELDSNARERIHQEGDRLVWEFAPKVAGEQPSRAAPQKKGKPKRPDQGTSYTGAPPNYPRTVTNPAKVDRVPGMSRKRLTIDLRGADIQNVLRLFAKEGGVNIIAGDGVDGAVTLRLKDVPLDEAFLIVLQSQGLGFEKRGSVIRVATQKKLLKEQKKRRKAKQRKQKTQPLEVFLMPVNYADAGDMTKKVERLLSPRGSVSVDERTNTLIIKDLPANIRSIRKLVSELDSQVPQVLIEARIVETNDTFSQEFGIQWGGDFTMSQGGGNPTGLVFPNVLGASGGATDGQTPTQGTAANPNFAVNLPAAAGTGTGGALGLTMGNVSGSVNLNLRLSAAEESGRAKIISAPKILTLDNREATISQGTSIPISVVSAAGVQTVFVDATLELTVTPHVTPDGNVQMEIEATKNEPDFQNTGARGDPTIIRKQAETELLIEDGETTVIGGIYTRNSGQSVTGIPVLHKIPILGLLFKSTSSSERRTELLIFITPRVVNRAEALGDQSAGNVMQGGASNASSGGGGGGGEQ